MKMYVGNLSTKVTEDNLKETFEAFGLIKSVTLVKDKGTGDSRGFGFIEMPSKAEAQAAIDGLNGTDLQGKTLVVNEARPRREHQGNRERRF
ncbi:RNA-binding protein [bacterium]|nr:RNA-binding protein [bacterium]